MRSERLFAAALAGWFVAANQFQPVRAETNKAVYEKAAQYKGPALQLLEKLVNIDSGSGDGKGLSAVGALVTDELRNLGARIETYPTPAPAGGDNIVATFTGSGKAKILLVAHMDTVFGPGTVAARPFRIQDGRAYGPGVMDDKGGIVIALYTLKILKDLNYANYAQITLMLNTNEETGSLASRLLIERLSKEHDVDLNLEPGRPADGLVVWRKGSGKIELEIKGKSAHAGVAPDSGRNAAMELAHQILQLSKLANRDLGTTVNFTVLKAGERSNIIPDHATAQADVRALVPEEFDRLEKDLSATSQNKLISDTEVKVSLDRHFPTMPKNAATEGLALKAQAIYAELGKKLTLEGSGGASDASFAAGVFKPTLDGLGIVGGEIHTAQEYAEIESIVPRLYLLSRMIMELSSAEP
ncbi:MAG: M20/M25/M40 family metallo-hydrolase [Methylobacteriaceae bacterium]|nr:M20/M25/M40 family metallo-hydrolase [Methylobacteriaceae bacterium]